MIENHTHDENGDMVLVEDHTDAAEVEAVEVAVSADVEIARINAEKEIQLAKIAAKTVEPDLEAQLAAAKAELEALRAIVEPPAPEPMEDTAPVVVVSQDSSDSVEEPEEESLPEPEPVAAEEEKPRKKAGLGYW